MKALIAPLLASLVFSIPLAANTAATKKVLARYDSVESKLVVPMLGEVVKFPTHKDDPDAHAAQKAWLLAKAKELGFIGRDYGKVTELELPGPKGAPVLGLLVHGDVQPVDADAWSFPPFSGAVADGYVLGRGSADDKGPLAQALAAMKALERSGVKRTHTIRLLVGSTEESDEKEIAEYLEKRPAPDYSLVLDSAFPVVVGEKAWTSFSLITALDERAEANPKPYVVSTLAAGLGPSIVPDRAEVALRWKEGTPEWQPIVDKLRAAKMNEGTRLVVAPQDDTLRIIAYGKSSHAGVNIAGGRNALVALANVVEGVLPAGGANDLLAFARMAGQDLTGTGLGITDSDPVWGRFDVNVATILPDEKDPRKKNLTINLRRIPTRTTAQLRAHLEDHAAKFNARTGSSFTTDGYWLDETLGFDPNARLVKRLMTAYTRATGKKEKPSISGGGTYAKRMPNSIAFGMWFPDKPYPGHDVDEKMPIADLDLGARVLIHALVDIATGPKIVEPFKP